MASADPRVELCAAQAEVEALEANIVVKQAASVAEKDKNVRASLNLEVKALERQKATAQRRQKMAQVKLRKAELAAGADPNASAQGAAAAQDDDWTAHVDPGSGNTYYCNAKTGETAWTKPECAVAKTDEAWTEQLDAGSGQTYYYNTTTGETSWTNPNAAVQEEKAVVTSVATSAWTEHLDEASGTTFFYNTQTGETSWTRPEEANEAAAKVEDDWQENTDPASGQTYFFNPKSGETSWTHPSAVGGA